MDLNKSISFSRSSKENKSKNKKKKVVKFTAPTKRTINFAYTPKKSVNVKGIIPTIVILILVVVIGGKFAIYDRFAKVAAKQEEVAYVQQQLDEGNAKIQSYKDLDRKYAHYTIQDMTEDELKLMDRNDVIDLIYNTIMSKVTVESWTINGNQIDLTITGSTLKQVNQLAGTVRESKIVSFCSVQTATKDEENTEVEATLTVYLNDAEVGGDSNEEE